MPQVNVKLSGYEKVVDLLDEIGKSAKLLGRTTFRLQSGLPYAHWIEEGFYMHGRAGRRKKGPARMMARGLSRIKEILKPAIVRHLGDPPSVLINAVSGVMGEGTKAAQAVTPVVSGDLRASLHTVRSERD